jgi:DNA polymerase-1
LLPYRKELVPGYGVRNAKLAIVGEAPGTQEVPAKRPFVGKAGQLLRSVLRAFDIDDENEVWWTNACLCHPPADATPKALAVVHCNSRLMDVELPWALPKKILSVGGTGLSAILRSTTLLPVTKYRGRGMLLQIGDQEVYSVPTYHPSAVLRDPDLFRDLTSDLDKLLNHTEPFHSFVECIVPSTAKEASAYLTELAQASVLSCDLETTGLSPERDTLLSIGFCALEKGRNPAGVSLILPRDLLFKTPLRADVLRLLTGDGPRLVFHNAKFDLKFLDKFYSQPIRPKQYWDTMLHHYSLDERPGGRYPVRGLKTLARTFYDAEDYAVEFWGPQGMKEMAQDDWAKLYEYQALDTYYTVRLYFDLHREAKKQEEGEISNRVMEELLLPATLAFKEIELSGTPIDRNYFRSLRDDLEEELGTLEERLRELAGNPSLNISSPAQTKDLIYNTWGLQATGRVWRGAAAHAKDRLRYESNPGTDRGILLAMLKDLEEGSREYEGVQGIIDYRLKSKILQTYVLGVLDRVDSEGLLHPEYLLHGTATGRLSCQNPNLQNIPMMMGPVIRKGFKADPGCVFMEADFKQLELRIAAHLSQDEAMLRAFGEGRDIHGEVAVMLFHKRPEEITPQERYMAKCMNFGIVYGRGAKSLAEGFEMEELERQGGKRWTLDEAEQYQRRFLAGFPGLTQWMSRVKRSTVRDHYVETILGRRRRFPLIQGEARSAIERQAVNTPIQGTASDICLRALTMLHFQLPDGARILFSVHDSIDMQVRKDLVTKVGALVQKVTKEAIPFESRIPFPVDIKVGPSWGEAKEYK